MDKTIMIPTPGAARSQEAGHGSNTGTSGSMEFDANGLQGLNPLVSSASVLLTLLNELRSTMQYSNVPGLHQKLTEEIRLFERNTQVNRLSNESMLLARYLLCTALDETVLNTPWGGGSGWSQHSLLGIFHQEASGGEKSFVILTRLLENPAAYIDVLELFYVCISLGFQGRYRMMPRGQEQLEYIRDTLIDTIGRFKEPKSQLLSNPLKGSLKRESYFKTFIPMWVFLSAVLAGVLISYLGFRYWAYEDSSRIINHIIHDQRGTNLIDIDTLYLNTEFSD